MSLGTVWHFVSTLNIKMKYVEKPHIFKLAGLLGVLIHFYSLGII